MIKSLYWNIRSIKSDGALERLKQMIISEKFPIIALSEPFYKEEKIDKYKRILGYHNSFSNSNSQIWICWDSTLDCQITDSDEQQVSCSINLNSNSMMITFIYAKCDENLREGLSDKLTMLSSNNNLP